MLANQILQAQAIIQQGGIVAYSTDTILGLGCDPKNKTAVERIAWLKQRSLNKGLILLVENTQMLEQYSQPLLKEQLHKISTVTKPTTWLFPKRDDVPTWLSGEHQQIAMRVVNHPIASKLSTATGAITSSSANFSRFSNVDTVQQLRSWFGPYVDYVIITNDGTGEASEIRDIISDEHIRKN